MPEMPEVETIRRDLCAPLLGRTIERVTFLWPRTAANMPSEEMAARLQGRKVVALRRRGKYLIIDLDPACHLIIHLRMTGRLHLYPGRTPAQKHTRVITELDNGAELHFWDQRKFGRFYCVEDENEVVGKLGPEPLADDWTVEAFKEALNKRRAPIKSLLLNQQIVAGIGNIYADEALFFAGIHPLRPGNSLNDDEVWHLHQAIRYVLREALKAQGSTFSTYRRPGEETGAYQLQHQVFRRTGKPCPVCRTPIERIKVGGRSTHFCPRCQV